MHAVHRYNGNDDDAAAAKQLGHRRAARLRLLDNCPGRWSESAPLLYNARHGAKSETLIDAAAEVYNDFVIGFLSAKPVIPALNRWNKIYAPLAWWLFALKFFRIVADALEALGAPSAPSANQSDFIHNVDLIGPMCEAMFRKVEKVRWKKGTGWLLAPSTPHSLCISVTLFRQALPLMGILFDSAKKTVR